VKTKFIFVHLALMAFLVSCQPAAPVPPIALAGEVETRVAASIYADQTATADTANVRATLTAIVPHPTDVPPAATPTPNTFNVSIPASACWMNSELNVITGQTVIISASGIVNTWSGKEISNGDPNGQPRNMCGAIECPLQGANYGALIGRLDDLETFLVGTEFEFTATKDGQLYFTVNDWECSDNSGTFELTITIEQP
jgi:hypothetical protein